MSNLQNYHNQLRNNFKSNFKIQYNKKHYYHAFEHIYALLAHLSVGCFSLFSADSSIFLLSGLSCSAFVRMVVWGLRPRKRKKKSVGIVTARFFLCVLGWPEALRTGCCISTFHSFDPFAEKVPDWREGLKLYTSCITVLLFSLWNLGWKYKMLHK